MGHDVNKVENELLKLISCLDWLILWTKTMGLVVKCFHVIYPIQYIRKIVYAYYIALYRFHRNDQVCWTD